MNSDTDKNGPLFRIKSADNDTLRIDSVVVKDLPIISANDLKKKINETQKRKIFILWATWCTYCKPYIKALPSIKEHCREIEFYTLNIDKEYNKKDAIDELNRYKSYSNNYMMKSNNSIFDIKNEKIRPLQNKLLSKQLTIICLDKVFDLYLHYGNE